MNSTTRRPGTSLQTSNPTSNPIEEYRSDWLVPFFHNIYVQVGVALCASGIAALALSFWFWRSISAGLLDYAIGFGFIAPPLGLLAIGSTNCGKFTVVAYRKARRQIKNRHNLTRKLPRGPALTEWADTYCVQAGVKAAALKYHCADELPPGFPSVRRVIRRSKRGLLGVNQKAE
ncbi:hypothetical protein [Burkholderia sp. LMG 32019]|uniref:hypothetical protein n=1 Tax=Burkholderia sp. LMG 32019 TaxID=3158173 RepID=UPI003C2F1416